MFARRLCTRACGCGYSFPHAGRVLATQTPQCGPTINLREKESFHEDVLAEERSEIGGGAGRSGGFVRLRGGALWVRAAAVWVLPPASVGLLLITGLASALRRGVAAGLMLGLASCSAADLLNATIYTGDVAIDRNVAYAPGPRHGLDVYRPERAAPGLPLVVFLYGGSWRYGNKSIYPFVAATLAKRGAVVMVPDYRVYPQVAFPGFLQDNAAAVAWAIGHAAQYGADPADVFIVGHSAGAYDAAMLALDPAWLAAVGVDRSRLRGVVGLAGPYDFLPITGPDIIPIFAPVQDGPASQPITYVDGHNPPMLLLAGSADKTVEPRNTMALAAKITADGGPVDAKIYPGVSHIGLVAAFAPVFQHNAPVLDDVWRFIQTHEAPALDGAKPLR